MRNLVREGLLGASSAYPTVQKRLFSTKGVTVGLLGATGAMVAGVTDVATIGGLSGVRTRDLWGAYEGMDGWMDRGWGGCLHMTCAREYTPDNTCIHTYT